MVLPLAEGVCAPLGVVSLVFSASYPQARRSYYLFFNYLFFNYLSVYPNVRRIEPGVYPNVRRIEPGVYPNVRG